MIQPERWVDRRFAFDVPPERHPVFRCRLAGAAARLEELTRNLSVAALTTRVDGKWSIQENAGHLYDLEAVADARLDDYLAGAAVLTHADTANPTTERARYNEWQLADVLAAFRSARQAWVARLDALEPALFSREAEHQRLGQVMRLVDFVAFIADHDDHHFARIRELRRLLTELPAGA